MGNPARIIDHQDITQEFGLIANRAEGLYSVETDQGSYMARQAVSCLVEPEKGDLVLIAIKPARDCYILAVLERNKPGKTTLAFESDLEIKTTGGRLGLAAQNGLDLVTPGQMALTSFEFSIDAQNGRINTENLGLWSRIFNCRLGKVRIAAQSIDSFAGRLYQRLKRSIRIVEEVDQLKAGRLRYLIKKTLILRGRYSQLSAKEEVQIDGQRVHIA